MGIFLKESGKSFYPLGYAFAIIQPVNGKDRLGLLYLVDLEHFRCQTLLIVFSGESFVIDAHGEGVHPDIFIFIAYDIKFIFETQKPPGAAKKMPDIIISVESDQVCPQKAFKYLLPPYKKSEYLK